MKAAKDTEDDLGRWLTAAQAGDRAAYERIYRKCSGAIYAFALRLTGEPSAAEEMAQEVFVRAWQRIGDIKNANHLQAWMRRVAINLRRNDLRTLARRGRTLSLDEPDEAPTPTTPPMPEGLRRDLAAALLKLPDGAREVLLLHDVHGYRHAEIADQLGLAVGTTKTQLHRARRRLREVLAR